MVHNHFPEKIITDQGRNFKWNLIELYKIAEVKKLETSPYHLIMNGQSEKCNSTLIHMLGTLP